MKGRLERAKRGSRIPQPPLLRGLFFNHADSSYPDKNDDVEDMTICLSKVYKAEKVELSEDRMSVGSCKSYSPPS
ncbi:hypothetical protein HanPI659440_Chr17g0695791 [Helianthus annuus]|nr:hypothetical protein HanPI659440_Chr17g0695791 [Helianthus annuus]